MSTSSAAEGGGGARAAQLADRLGRLRERVAAAAAAAGRDPGGLTVVVVTKFFPVADVQALAGLGVLDVGESRDQEASAKAAALAAAHPELRWHFVGQLQTNKARSVARYASAVHSVDRVRLARALAAGAAAAGREVDCFVQVDLAAALGGPADPARGGAAGDDVLHVADAVAAAVGLRLAGLMAVAPRGQDPARAFAELAAVAERVRRAHPGAVALSAGMSGDLEAAVAAGATHLRVGSAVLGTRPGAR
ncbi:YggS family pyridoxal phosphate-dependent enzyme [Paenibacillus sp. TRM 82003]|uniref:YggS family pyridoxal phosphate-dependent enzyme n=1 Tax=Kineococcus sp. TRM81007 TaxID=2925831 RepID=UPI001F58A4D5|nr:YggS family pyridoxal phosphate-dependent enzyme [Kineococcus sp. TRM81007]MCI2239709.1 YggS family pyridoxal phosphate-dependent enzyme [Kineococcus sp. TRM81007]MCI3926728.1 YggS family pyridoxal phosphate-dependent enzyme [Paenibacillus sp. TRM 82003]